jgi:hypothetical protein
LLSARDASKCFVYSYAIMEALKMNDWNDKRLDERDKELKEGFAEVRAEMKEGFTRLEAQILAGRQDMERQILAGRQDMERQILAGRQEMKEGFERVDKRFEKVDGRFERMDDRFAALNRALLTGAIAIIAVLLGAQLA